MLEWELKMGQFLNISHTALFEVRGEAGFVASWELISVCVLEGTGEVEHACFREIVACTSAWINA